MGCSPLGSCWPNSADEIFPLRNIGSPLSVGISPTQSSRTQSIDGFTPTSGPSGFKLRWWDFPYSKATGLIPLMGFPPLGGTTPLLGFSHSAVPDRHSTAGIFPTRSRRIQSIVGWHPTSGPFQFAGVGEPMIAWHITYIREGFLVWIIPSMYKFHVIIEWKRHGYQRGHDHPGIIWMLSLWMNAYVNHPGTKWLYVFDL